MRLEDRVETALASKDWEEGYAAYKVIQVLERCVRLEDRVETALASKDWEEAYAAYEDIQVLSFCDADDSEQICVAWLMKSFS